MESVDRQVLEFINIRLANGVLDRVMAFLTDPYHWLPVIVLLALFVISKRGVRVLGWIAVGIVLVTLSDALVFRILKPLFGRTRPCVAYEWVRTPAGKSWAPSFPSAHATNAFALAAYFSHFLREYRIPFFISAFVVAFSRVYLGLHYPSDVVAGAALGTALGLLTAKLVGGKKAKRSS